MADSGLPTRRLTGEPLILVCQQNRREEPSAVATVSLPHTSKTAADDNLFSDVKANDQAIIDQVNGNLENANISASAEIEGTKLASSFLDQVGVDGTSTVRRGVTSIATEETTTSTSFTKLSTADEVENVVVPANGQLIVDYRALWKLTGAGSGGDASVAIFVGADQLKAMSSDYAPGAASNTLPWSGDNYGLLYTSADTASGLSDLESHSSDSSTTTTAVRWGPASPAVIEVAAGTYDVSIQYHVNATSGGTLAVKERLLRVYTRAF